MVIFPYGTFILNGQTYILDNIGIVFITLMKNEEYTYKKIIIDRQLNYVCRKRRMNKNEFRNWNDYFCIHHDNVDHLLEAKRN